MTPSLTGTAARDVVNRLRPQLNLHEDEPLRAWGPVIANQYDFQGLLIQQYLSVLIQRRSGGWLLLRQVTNLPNGQACLIPPIEIEVRPEDARRWLADNQLLTKDSP